MSKKSFKFKQFEVYHDKTAMKVGTDGVLLGAWVDLTDAVRVLDVGTGTGLIALMVAQRRRNVEVNAIEIDDEAVIQARENVVRSPFECQIKIEKISFQHFVECCNQKFDVVVSNPPFFIDALHSHDIARTTARHNKALSIYDLLELSNLLLNQKGRLAMIYPANDMEYILKVIEENGWKLLRKTDVYTTVNSNSPKRVLLEMCYNVETDEVIGDEWVENRLYIEKLRHQYTDEYVELTRDFYLKM